MLNSWRYRHPQVGAVVVGSLAASALFLRGMDLTLGDQVLSYGGLVILGSAALLFYPRTVEIDATHPRFRFGVGLGGGGAHPGVGSAAAAGNR